MSTSEEVFFEELRQVFAAEADEHLQTLASGLVEIEKAKDPSACQAVTEAVYRAAHSLKGAARSVNLPVIASVCQSMETVLSAMKKGLLSPDAAGFDVLQRAVDEIARVMASPQGGADGPVKAVITQLERLATGAKGAEVSSPLPSEKLHERAVEAASHAPAEPAAPGPAVAPASDTIRVTAAKLDAVLLRAEELIAVKLAAEQRLAELADTVAVLESWEKERKKAEPQARGALSRSLGLDRAGAGKSAATGLPDSDASRLQELDKRLAHLQASLMADRRTTGTLVNQLLEETKSVLMLPFSTLLQTFPKMVRDISRERSKEVNLVLTGAETEIYKRILEKMKDPLLHLLRNAIDHGVETPDERRALNKAPCGTITVGVSQVEGSHVRISVADDGAGIDTAKLRAIAAERNLLSRDAADALDERSAQMLIFQSGVSTSAQVSDLSGRGLGMAIVQEAVDKLGGRIAVETEKGKGTAVSITLPLTLATSHGLLLKEYGQLLVIPLANVERALRIQTGEVRTLEGREAILVDGAALSLVRLGAVLGIAENADESGFRHPLCVLVLAYGQKRVAFAFDSLLGEQEILIKGLGKQLARVRNISGATVLGSGKVALIVNVADLMASAVRARAPVLSARATQAAARRKSLLVVEDSITSRLLLKNILVSAGFDVCTAVDGAEAWSTLQAREVDGVVSDIDMPRMNGFELTQKIRADKKLSGLPVVLVTALKSQASRERGAEVGADAYIVKSSFDQSNLLDVVRRLI